MLLAQIVERRAKNYSNKVAFRFDDGFSCTFGEYNDRIDRIGHSLFSMGLEIGDRIAFLLTNSMPVMDVYGVAMKTGLIAVPLNTRLGDKEIKYIIEDCQPRVLIVEKELYHLVEKSLTELNIEHVFGVDFCMEAISPYGDLLKEKPHNLPNLTANENDPVIIFYTSGTTGLPKGVLTSHKSQIENCKTVLIELSVGENDVMLNPLPLFHIGGFSLTLLYFYRGCTNIIMKKFKETDIFEICEKFRPTTILNVPAMIGRLIHHPEFKVDYFRSLRNIYYSGAPISSKLLTEGIRTLGNVFFQAYGMTETGPTIALLNREDHIIDSRRLTSCGKPALDVEVKLIREDGTQALPGEIGEIVVKSDLLMNGYWNKPEATKLAFRDLWFCTGDIGRFDEDGYLYIVDRKKDMIISGGENIYSIEVEEVIAKCPAVNEVAVIGIPDDSWGEAIKAYVVLKPGERASAEDIKDLCKERLAGYKKPKVVEFVDQLSRNELGKVDKQMLRSHSWQGMSRKVN